MLSSPTITHPRFDAGLDTQACTSAISPGEVHSNVPFVVLTTSAALGVGAKSPPTAPHSTVLKKRWIQVASFVVDAAPPVSFPEAFETPSPHEALARCTPTLCGPVACVKLIVSRSRASVTTAVAGSDERSNSTSPRRRRIGLSEVPANTPMPAPLLSAPVALSYMVLSLMATNVCWPVPVQGFGEQADPSSRYEPACAEQFADVITMHTCPARQQAPVG